MKIECNASQNPNEFPPTTSDMPIAKSARLGLYEVTCPTRSRGMEMPFSGLDRRSDRKLYKDEPVWDPSQRSAPAYCGGGAFRSHRLGASKR